MKFFLHTGFALLAVGCLTVSAQESRTWTDTKGRTLTGVFVRQDDSTVWVKRDDGKEIPIPKKSLSAGDLKQLESIGGGGSGGGGEAGAAVGRFATVKVDPSKWAPRTGGFGIGSLTYPASLETEHFIVAGAEKTRPALMLAYADAAERLWADIATDLPSLTEVFKGRKMPIILVDGEKEAAAFASWHEKHAEDSPTVRPESMLDTSTIAPFSLDPKFAAEAGLSTTGRLFRLDSKKAEHNRKTWPERIHFLSGDLFRQVMGRPKDNGSFNLGMVVLSFSYQREELICGRIESEIFFGGDSEVEGFKNGRNWAGATKKLLKGGANPDIKSYLESSAAKAEPRDLGFGLGLMRFIHDDPARNAGWGKMLDKVRKEEKCPTDEEFTKAIGFDSPQALNAAWKEYMLSDKFQ